MRYLVLMALATVLVCGGCGGAPKYTVPIGVPTSQIRLVDKSSLDVGLVIYEQHEGCIGRKWLFGYWADGSVVKGETPFKAIQAGKTTSFTVWHYANARFCQAHFQFTPQTEKYYTVVAVDNKKNCGATLLVSDKPKDTMTSVEGVRFPTEKRKPMGDSGSWCGPLP